MFEFITNPFKKVMTDTPEETMELVLTTTELEIDQVDEQDDIKDVIPLFNNQLDLVASVLKEVVYLYTQTGAGISSELQERIRQAQQLLER